MISLKEWAKEVKSIRESLGLSQRQLAALAGLHWMGYSRIERGEGNPTFQTMAKILEALKTASAHAQKKRNSIEAMSKMGLEKIAG